MTEAERAALVEKMARALAKDSLYSWKAYVVPASRALAAYEAHMTKREMVSVPKEPTNEMIEAALVSTSSYLNLIGSQLQRNREKMRIRYRAMLTAATAQKEPQT